MGENSEHNSHTQVTCQWQVLKVNGGTIETTYGNAYMVCEWTDGREPKDGAKCTKESWAVLETGNLGDDLYHGDDCLNPILLR